MARMMGGITGKGGKSVAPLYKETVTPTPKPKATQPQVKWEDTRKAKAKVDKQSMSVLKSFGMK